MSSSLLVCCRHCLPKRHESSCYSTISSSKVVSRDDSIISREREREGINGRKDDERPKERGIVSSKNGGERTSLHRMTSSCPMIAIHWGFSSPLSGLSASFDDWKKWRKTFFFIFLQTLSLVKPMKLRNQVSVFSLYSRNDVMRERHKTATHQFFSPLVCNNRIGRRKLHHAMQANSKRVPQTLLL